VRNTKTGKLLTGTLSSKFYLRFHIGGKNRLAHRLVMAAAAGRTLGRHEIVRHLDGNPGHNAIENLAIGSAKQNCQDKITHNTNGRRLRNADVWQIRALARRHGTRDIARRFNVSRTHVINILAGRHWFNLP
jgi:hypothetical protein